MPPCLSPGGPPIRRLCRASFLLPAVFLLGITAALGAGPSAEAPPRPEDLIASLQKKYEATRTLAAELDQENELRSLGQTTRSRGTVHLEKPGRIRVEYTEPEAQLIVADGNQLWVYTPRLKQVIASGIGGAPSAPFLFLAGRGELSQTFEVKVEDYGTPPRAEGAWRAGQPHRLSLTPRQPQAGFQQMWIEVDPQSFQITALEYTDPLGNRSRMRFSRIREGESLPASLFQFEVPQGAEVLRLPGQGAPGR
ncbi:MAG: outer membrane lipoprotein carrier protein LolA [Nitrospinota bacterium]